MALTKQNKELISKFSMLFRQNGFSPAFGKIAGYLLISEPPHKTFDEIKDDLQLSKGAVSNTLKTMELLEFIEYFTQHGDRKRYFKLSLQNWKNTLQVKINESVKFNVLMQEVLIQRDNANEVYNQKLKEIIQLEESFQERLRQLIDELR